MKKFVKQILPLSLYFPLKPISMTETRSTQFIMFEISKEIFKSVRKVIRQDVQR